MNNQSQSPATIWQTAYGELQLQIPRETFDTWLRHARLIAHEDGTYVIGVQNIYAREWLEQRLKKVIVRTLSRIAQRTVEVRFVLVTPRHNEAPEPETAGPLLAPLEKTTETPRFEHLPPGETALNPRQTFETYAVGSCNRLAVASAQSVVEMPASQFNPLFVCGDVGTGKSHILHAIGNACQEQGQRVLYVSAETFTNDLVASIKTRKTNEFREKYRNVDVLLVDDVQFLAGKDSSQEEFFHTFNDLFNMDAQIVVSANRPPTEIRRLDARLRSRFEGGLVAEINTPDYLTRVDILEIKAGLRGFNERVSLDVLERIAEEVTGSVRELEGALNRVVASALLTHDAPTLEATEAILQQVSQQHNGPETPALEDIVMATAEYYGVTPEDIYGRGRARDVSTARQVAMYLAREEGDVPLQQIGEFMGGRNHSTVLYSCDRISDLMATDSMVRRQVQAIMRSLQPQRDQETEAKK